MMLHIYSLERQIQDLMQTAHVPGLALAIVKNQEILYARGFGVTSVEDSGMPVTPQTLFRIGSVTKPLTGTMIMRLVDEGKLELDSPVRAYLPWFTLSEPGAAERVTLRMLLCHMSGLPHDHTPFGPREPGALATRIRQEIPQLPLVAPPGIVYSYSDGGIQVLAHVAEVVTGKFYAELMQELVFNPLEMSRSTFDPTIAMTYPLAQSHEIDENDILHVEHKSAENTAQASSGRAFSTVLDLANFAIMHLHWGSFRGKQFLSESSVREMHTIQADYYMAPGYSYGLTFEVGMYNGKLQVGHSGQISNFGTRLEMFPEVGIAVILVFNHISVQWIDNKILHLTFDQLLGPSPVPPTPQPIEPDRSLWSHYTGLYLGNKGLATIQIIDNQLMLNWYGEKLILEAIRKSHYVAKSERKNTNIYVGFPPSLQGQIYITIDKVPFKLIEPDQLFVVDPEILQVYTGNYKGKYGMITVYAEEGTLLIQPAWADKPMSCIALDNRHFAWELGPVEFLIDENGSVLALEIDKSFTFKRVETMLE